MFSALIPGIAVGSALGDYFGGFYGKGMINSLKLCIFYAVLSTFFSVSLAHTFEVDCFIILMWLFFFSGAGIMPIGQGIIVSCVPKKVSNSANAFYNICTNILAISYAPVLSGHIMESYKNKRLGMIAGYRVPLYTCFVLLVLYNLAVIAAIKQ